mmetsp:Transcript_17804/g.17882  ORF Transcript_17804/g.17882 Transcript_17804/m.17882 type:complete len:129 (+) Transcript_17804:98-484(+)|eukprot:CAMPEP_0182428354 /NCGR_PEP_ID=MMETSP1167-20130531/22535_1 /TAXON_ID=2988 /ORGANISM="Mallomonas Sp, Strain CCMP3275" /LENGTH=128 /DNA_ID=CAMNT_0024611203 /DNA_START=78 /DNA_END=464 /DNA_ORIENTATION=-
MSTEVDEKAKYYRSLEEERKKLIAQKQQLHAQLNENLLVKGELDILTEKSQVYKLVGPVLMTVDLEESKSNVEKRLEFIEGEIKKIDIQLDIKQSEQKKIGEEVAEIQRKMQENAVKAVQEITEKSPS